MIILKEEKNMKYVNFVIRTTYRPWPHNRRCDATYPHSYLNQGTHLTNKHSHFKETKKLEAQLLFVHLYTKRHGCNRKSQEESHKISKQYKTLVKTSLGYSLSYQDRLKHPWNIACHIKIG